MQRVGQFVLLEHLFGQLVVHLFVQLLEHPDVQREDVIRLGLQLTWTLLLLLQLVLHVLLQIVLEDGFLRFLSYLDSLRLTSCMEPEEAMLDDEVGFLRLLSYFDSLKL